MRKKDKLYTANKWNRPLFAQGIDRENQNIFDVGSKLDIPRNPQLSASFKPFGNTQIEGLDHSTIKPLPENKQVSKSKFGQGVAGSYIGMGLSAMPTANFKVGGNSTRNGMFDALDPTWYLADGKESKVGNALSDTGVALTKSGNPYMMLAGAGLKIFGSLANAGWGYKRNEANISAIENSTKDKNEAGRELAQVGDSGSFFDMASRMTGRTGFNPGDLIEGGWFVKDKARRKGLAYINRENAAFAQQGQGMTIGANNVDRIMDDNIMANFAAYGGPLGMLGNADNMGAIEYGLMSDWLDTKREKSTAEKLNTDLGLLAEGGKIEIKHPGRLTALKKRTGKTEAELYNDGNPAHKKMVVFARNSRRWNKKALGGDLETNIADYPTGLVHIDAGGSHSENPYDGVQMGVDAEGTPNLVEEGEVIFNDYVFSNRITCDDNTKKAFHIGKKREISYADLAKKLEKEIQERPNDPISKAAFKAQMEELADHQERQKQEMKEEEARQAFESLSPEEKVAVMQQVAGQQVQEAEMASQPTEEEMAAQQQMTQPSPEEAAMMQQQAMQGDSNIQALGGNLFAGGGVLSKQEFMQGALKELQGKGYTQNMMREIANAMYKRYSKKPVSTPRYSYYYNDLHRGWRSTDDAYQKNYEEMRRDGISPNTAFAVLKSVNPSKFNKDSYGKVTSGREVAYQNRSSNNTASKTSTSSQEKPTQTSKAAAKVSASPKANRRTVYSASDGRVFNTREEAMQYNRSLKAANGTTSQIEAAPAPVPAPSHVRVQNNPAPTPTTVISDGLRPYSYYTNGSDGLGEPVGFTVGDNGLIDKENGYTQAYRDLVAKLGADDIRKWAEEHPNDPSLLSFLDNGNRLEDLTDEQWRTGALDGKYGFMHHVADSILQGTPDNTPEGEASVQVSPELSLPEGNAKSYYVDDAGKWIEIDTNGPLPEGFIPMQQVPTNNPAYQNARFYRGQGRNYLIGPDGSYSLIEGDVPKDYTLDLSAQRALDDNGKYSVIDKYYLAPEQAKAVAAQQKEIQGGSAGGSGSTGIEPIIQNEKARYVGLAGPAVGLAMMAAGIGKPKYRELNDALNTFDRRGASMADYRPIGNYLRYTPMDIWAEQNRLDANARATDRALSNNAAPIGTRMAGLLANAYNNQLASGQLYRQALEYNDNKRHQVADFNRATDIFNANAYNSTSQFNAGVRNQDRATRANLAMRIANQKMDADASWYNSLYGNVGALFKGIGDYGRENADMNWRNRLAVAGVFGNMDDDKMVEYGLARYKAKGGKINKKKGRRGLTF